MEKYIITATEPSGEQEGLDLQRGIEMKILDIVYLNENVDIHSQLLSRCNKWMMHSCTDILLRRLQSFIIYLVPRRRSHIIKSFAMVHSKN